MSNDRSPFTDELALAQAPVRGRLRIFFGATAGVGKTCAMLQQAATRRGQGADVAIGIVETHGRAEAQALVGATPVLAPGAGGELDLDAALARRPAVLLVDEFAHANAAGARHAKRWQDVEALCAAGIEVWTTLDVQQLESLNDVVAAIAGARAIETVPDRLFDDADDVVVVDLAPDELLRRWREGRVALSPRAALTARQLFRKGKLLALRELALRRVADRGAPGANRAREPRPEIAGGAPVRMLAALFAPAAPRPSGWRPYASSAALCAAVTLATEPLQGVLDPSNIVMLFLLAVLVAALRHGRGPAVFAAFLAVAAFDFFDVAPRFSLAVGDPQILVTFAVMLIVALVIGQLTAGLTRQAQAAALREDRVRTLYELSRDLSAALLPEQIVELGTRVLEAGFDARAVFLLPDARDTLPDAGAHVDRQLARQAYERGTPVAWGATLYLPLKAPMRVRGVVALGARSPQRLADPEQRRLLDTFASLLAIALERVHYVEVAQRTTVQMESERLRNALLGAISHDLRTPLAALAGMADSLQLTAPALAPQHAGIARKLREGAQRMSALVDNLLDMARLQSGRVALDLQWQPLEEIVGSALRGLEPLLVGRHPVRVCLPADLPLLRVDAVLIERVLVNLLENACKYTPADAPIEIGSASAGDVVEAWVADSGPGLPPGREEQLFDKFERGAKESATPGVGLGLAICRAIVAAHGGTIRGETRAEGGARFVFALPRGEPPTIDESLDVAPADNAQP